MTIKLTVVIPTKNRENDLITLVDSLMLQSRLPDELIIVDQSDTPDSKNNITGRWTKALSSELVYILDPSIKGLVDAKRVGSDRAKNELVCFLDDDLILDKHFIREMVKPFEHDSSINGSSGIFINFPKMSKFYKIIFSLFHRGIFKDPRPAVFRTYLGYSNELVKTSVLWGGITAWRRRILKEVPFDTHNSLFMMEDFDYSRKVRETIEDGMFINPNARAIHNHSLVNRPSEADQEERKIFEYMSYYKKSKHGHFSLMQLVWLLIGLFLDVLYKSIRSGNVTLIKAYLNGIKRSKYSEL
ncbi:glycosyltransferase [Porticoccaceae bacterium]|nr:glycosyltransferase [Porticoccaceae bacterium]